MNHRKSEVEETSVIPNPFSLWCGKRNHGLKYASVLPTVGAEIGLTESVTTGVVDMGIFNSAA